MKSRLNLLVLLVCFFLSGVAGLIYQVAWTKALGLVFGHTVYAIATVLATFMAGLAAGGVFLGKWGGRQRRPVVTYAWLELLIAITGAFSLVGLYGVRSLYLTTYHLVSGWPPILIVVRVIASALILFLPTFLMGGTLPILVRGFAGAGIELGSRLSRLYWINTAGGVVGALAGGFLLLPAIGLRWTVMVAAALNLAAGGLAVLASTLAGGTSAASPSAADANQEAAGVVAKTPRLLLVTFAVVGATAMAYEIAWSRLLATTLGSSTYAFTIMLATFLAGIVIGSFLFDLWISRRREVSIATFATTQTLTGLGGLAFLIIFQWLPGLPLALIRATDMTFGGLVLAQFVTCALAMLPAAIIFGFNFPVVTLLIAGRTELGAGESALVGRACAANTVGAILGALAAGFWLLPWLGSFRLIAMTVAANLALALFLQTRRAPRRAAELFGNAALAVIVIAVAWLGLLYDPQIANFSVVNHPEQYSQHLGLGDLAHRADLLFAEDGLNASIQVERAGYGLVLKTNGKADASTQDRPTQLMLGHLGAIFHPAPKRVLVIGFGTGMTVSAVARYPDVQQIDCVEIEPAVLHASPYLASLNRGVLSDPRVHIILDDARNFLFATRNRYDLIISEPSNPWIAGVATLFTQEFYQQARARLEPGGLFVQWVQAYSIFPEDMRMILGTVALEFPQVTLWVGEPGDYLVLAQSDAEALSFDRLRRLWSNPALLEDYRQLELQSPEGLIAYRRLDDPDVRRLVVGTRPNTDDQTRLEYRAPQALLALGAFRENQRMIARARTRLLPAFVSVADAPKFLIAAAQTSMSRQDYPDAGAFLAALPQHSPSAEIELLRGQWLEAMGKLDDARQTCESARTLDASSTPIVLELAKIARLQKDYAASQEFLRQILLLQPGFRPALQEYAMLEVNRGNFAQALEWQIKSVRGDPAPQVVDLNVLGFLFVRVGDDRRAESVYAASLIQAPYDFGAHFRLGEIYLRGKRWEEASRQLEAVVRYYPTERPEPYADLAQAYFNLQRPHDAESTLDKGQRLFPGDISLSHTPVVQ